MNHFMNILLYSFICSLILFTNCGEDTEDVVVDTDSDFIYLDENGITIKASENAVIGENYELNGISYLIVDKDLLAQMIVEEKDITNVITSRLTDMVGMFYRYPFNQDISSWDVSNVTDCRQFSYETTTWALPKPNFTNCTE